MKRILTALAIAATAAFILALPVMVPSNSAYASKMNGKPFGAESSKAARFDRATHQGNARHMSKRHQH
jgi:hypothetical protein